MHRTSVSSEVLCSVGYDANARILEIEFASGSVYRYFQVPDSVFCELMTAASHGEFFANHVRDAGFDYTQAD